MSQDFWSVPRLWAGHAAFIIAGGPSVATQDLSLLRGRKVVVANSSYQAWPDADYLIYHDWRWWNEHRKRLSAFAGGLVWIHDKAIGPATLRDSGPPRSKDAPWAPLLPSDEPDAVPVRATILTGAINFAMHLGAAPIVLLGADGRNQGNRKHHHAEHSWAQVATCFADQRADLDTFAPALRQRGVTILNASPGSALPYWPVMSLAEAIARADAMTCLAGPHGEERRQGASRTMA